MSGEWGAEVDALGEEFGSGIVFSDDLTDEPVDDLTEDLRFREESTLVSGLLRLVVRDPSRRFRMSGRLETAPKRTRGEWTTELSLPTSVGRFEFLDVFQAQGGPDDPGAGVANWATGSWHASRGAHRFRLALTHEASRAGADSLAQVLDYGVFRPSFRWSVPWESILFTAETGSRHKRGGSSRSLDHDGVYGRVVGERNWRGGGRLTLESRIDARTYAESDSITPSFQELTGTATGAWPLAPRHSLRFTAGVESREYAIDSSVLRDHRKAEIEASWDWNFRGGDSGQTTVLAESSTEPDSEANEPTDKSPLDLLDGILADLDEITGDSPSDREPEHLDPPSPDPDAAHPDPTSSGDLEQSGSEDDWIEGLSGPDRALWSLRFLASAHTLWNQVGEGGEFDELSAGLALSRETLRSGWFDLELRWGERDYAASGEDAGLVFEGFNFSLVTTDYRFLRSSALVEVPLPARFEFDLFGQFEREWHSEDANDLELWILTASLTRRF